MINDGIANEVKIAQSYNEKHINNLSLDQRKIINQLGDFSPKSIITAQKITGSHKADIEFIIENKKYNISVKKGTGNSIHQEKTDSFVKYCKEYLDMTEEEKNALLLFLYGDGTLDGSGDLADRLDSDKVKTKYKKEIELLNSFFNKYIYELSERFLITGKYGKDDLYKADHLYHGDDKKGVICPLNENSLKYISSLKVKETNEKDTGLVIGPFTVQTWNRNLSGKKEFEYKRDSIQIKCSNKFIDLIDGVNKYCSLHDVKEHIPGNNCHGIKNQEFIVGAINGKKYRELNSNLRQMIKIIFPTVKNTDILYAHVIQDKKIKARISITLKDETHYLTVKMGHKNSVHQEKKENFLNFCNDIPTDARNAFLKFLYGDGTIDGTGKLINRVNEKEAIKMLGREIDPLLLYLSQNKKRLAERFLIDGSYNSKIKAEYIYYGDETNGVTIKLDKVIDFIMNQSDDDIGHKNQKKLSIGPLEIQTWNRNLSGKEEFEYKRDSIQIKWPTLDFDLKELALKNLQDTSSNIGTNIGTLTEYNLVSLLNRSKNPNHTLWKEICDSLNISDLTNIYAVRVTNRVYSKLSEKYVLPKSDIYLIESKIPKDFLISVNYWIDEDNLNESNINYKTIPNSGISCKNIDSSSFTYTKLTINSFIKLFKYPELGAAISLFTTPKDLLLNINILNYWNLESADFKSKIENFFDIQLSSVYLTDTEECKKVKRLVIDKLKFMIKNSIELQDKLFKGKGIYDEPYAAYFIYKNGIIKDNIINKFNITTGSGRHKGKITIVIKP